MDNRKHQSRRALKLAEWPATDQIAWHNAIADGDIFEDQGRGHHWREKTKTINIQHYGRWLGYLKWRNILNGEDAPAARVTQQNIKTYYEHLKEIVAPKTRLSMLVGLKETIRAMAPDENWRWLQDICNRVQTGAKPTRENLNHIPASDVMYQTALGILSGFTGPITIMRDAVNFRDALLFALLIARPLRVKNMFEITIGKHLIWIDGEWRLKFIASEVKNNRPIEFSVPETLVCHLERYLEEVRTVFRNTMISNRLWLGQDGDIVCQSFVYDRITKLTHRLFGTQINPHLLRHCAATLMAINSSDSVKMATPLLGHQHRSTTEKYYIKADNLEASRNVNQILYSILQT